MGKPDDDRDYLWDRSGPPDPEVERLEQLLAPLAHDRPLRAADELAARRSRRAPWIAGALVAVAAAAVLVIVLRPRAVTPSSCTAGEGMAFVASGGTVACSGAAHAQGVLPVGGVLDTGTSQAQLTIATIGTARLFADTRVRLDRTDPERHQLHLERGRMHARVDAPPRLFAITTPSTSVTDLGCEYTIEIDAEGRGSIVVQSGKVELANDRRVIVAPAGTTTRLLPGRTPSLPLTDGASAELRSAVDELERGVAGALDRILGAARDGDAITLISLAELAPADRRADVLTRLATLIAPPDGVSVESAVGAPAQREAWRDEVVDVHLAQQVLRTPTKTPQPRR